MPAPEVRRWQRAYPNLCPWMLATHTPAFACHTAFSGRGRDWPVTFVQTAWVLAWGRGSGRAPRDRRRREVGDSLSDAGASPACLACASAAAYICGANVSIFCGSAGPPSSVALAAAPLCRSPLAALRPSRPVVATTAALRAGSCCCGSYRLLTTHSAATAISSRAAGLCMLDGYTVEAAKQGATRRPFTFFAVLLFTPAV